MTQGIRLEGKKEATLLVWTIRRFDPPQKVRIAIRQNPEIFAVPRVSVGDKVKTGEVLAVPANENSVFIHASVSGTVAEIGLFPHPILGKAEGIEIETDSHEQKAENLFVERKNWETLNRGEILKIFREFGLVDLEMEMTPVHTRAAQEIEVLILNACEPEPYQTGEHALMMSHPAEILKGIEILRKVTHAKRVVIAIQDDKLEVAETIKSKIFFMKWKNMEVDIIPSVYPQGKEAMLRLKYSGQKVEIFNIATVYAVYEAVAQQKPFFERVVTVGGECVIEPKNIWARMGMDFETAIKGGKGFLRQPRKVLMGGPMTGLAQETLEVPVIAGTQAILGLPEELTKPENAEPCIRCGVCAEVCPVAIHPALITLAAEQDLFDLSRDYGAQACIECGNCTYVCPSKRPMVELIRYGLGKDSGDQKIFRKTSKRRKLSFLRNKK